MELIPTNPGYLWNILNFFLTFQMQPRELLFIKINANASNFKIYFLFFDLNMIHLMYRQTITENFIPIEAQPVSHW